jgi:glycosyltransferase involved in cell wall biosynthesis
LRYLEESVQSILNQTFRDFHYYIAIDGPVPSDIEEYLNAQKDERIRLYRIEKNGGLASALNHLLEAVLKNPEYRYIARMDADDISLPERFEKQRNFLINNPNISVLGSWYEEIDENGERLSYRKLPVNDDDIKKYFNKRSPFAHPSVMLSRRTMEICKYRTNTYRFEDYFLWCDVINAGLEMHNLSEYLLRFRIDDDFYNRRSGLKFGLHYIICKFRINSILQSSLNSYIFALLIGIIRMMPVFVVKNVYQKVVIRF